MEISTFSHFMTSKIQIKEIQDSLWINLRKKDDEKKMNEITNSIRKKGLGHSKYNSDVNQIKKK